MEQRLKGNGDKRRGRPRVFPVGVTSQRLKRLEKFLGKETALKIKNKILNEKIGQEEALRLVRDHERDCGRMLNRGKRGPYKKRQLFFGGGGRGGSEEFEHRKKMMLVLRRTGRKGDTKQSHLQQQQQSVNNNYEQEEEEGKESQQSSSQSSQGNFGSLKYALPEFLQMELEYGPISDESFHNALKNSPDSSDEDNICKKNADSDLEDREYLLDEGKDPMGMHEKKYIQSQLLSYSLKEGGINLIDEFDIDIMEACNDSVQVPSTLEIVEKELESQQFENAVFLRKNSKIQHTLIGAQERNKDYLSQCRRSELLKIKKKYSLLATKKFKYSLTHIHEPIFWIQKSKKKELERSNILELQNSCNLLENLVYLEQNVETNQLIIDDNCVNGDTNDQDQLKKSTQISQQGTKEYLNFITPPLNKGFY